MLLRINPKHVRGYTKENVLAREELKKTKPHLFL